MQKDSGKLVFSLVVSFAAAGLGSLFTTPALTTWYANLEKPALNPPNWVFGPVWTVLYFCMGLALYLYWTSQSSPSKRLGFVFFGLQLVLNILWSAVFFGLRSPQYGTWTILLLWLAIAATIATFLKQSRVAALLLVPYLAWVSFATYLTIRIAALN